MFKPKKIRMKRTEQLRTELVSNIDKLIKMVMDNGLQVYVVDQKRGRIYYNKNVITVPWWTFKKKDKEYYKYYLSHELSHAIVKLKFPDTFSKINHGPEFMEIFKRICPKHLQHYELNYKPRLAKVAGITEKAATRKTSGILAINKYLSF